jgi:hypothetical protein
LYLSIMTHNTFCFYDYECICMVCMYVQSSLVKSRCFIFLTLFYFSLLQSYASSCYYFNILYIPANRRRGNFFKYVFFTLFIFLYTPNSRGGGFLTPPPFPRSPLDHCTASLYGLFLPFCSKLLGLHLLSGRIAPLYFISLDLAATINGKVDKPYDNYQDHTVSKDKVNKSYKNQDF